MCRVEEERKDGSVRIRDRKKEKRKEFSGRRRWKFGLEDSNNLFSIKIDQTDEIYKLLNETNLFLNDGQKVKNGDLLAKTTGEINLKYRTYEEALSPIIG